MSNSKFVLPLAISVAISAVAYVSYRRRAVKSRRATPAESAPSTGAVGASITAADRTVKSSKCMSYGACKRVEGVTVDEVYVLTVPHLADGKEPNAILNDVDGYNKIVTENNVILGDIVRDESDDAVSLAFKRAGPRRYVHFSSDEVRAAIVTCGGLCPGLNNVVREVVMTLWDLYRVRNIMGIKDGFSGLYADKYIELTPEVVANVHHSGGTFLGTCRGAFDLDAIMGFVKKHRLTHLYVVGGDGTHRAANKIYEQALAEGLNLAVAGIPKTIDNDIDLIDRSFGFNTAVEKAIIAIDAAKTEASCAPNGIGLVKLMGRHSGFIAAHATLSSGDVDLCLVPEVPISLRGESGCLPHLKRVLEKRGNAVVVVAEGAGEELLGESMVVDASGNRRLPNIGAFVKDEIKSFFGESGIEVNVKYIDPSYMIRSVPANASDALYCMLLAQNAVHGAMAGFTGFTVGLCNNRVVFLPITALVAHSPRLMHPGGRTWERVLNKTGQPRPRKLEELGDKTMNMRTVF